MIVCVCARVSDRQIIKMMPAEPYEVMVETRCAMNCGKCFEHMLQLIEKNKATDEPGLSSI